MNPIVVREADGFPRVSVREGGREVELPALWLRQYSPEASECDPITGQRLFDPHLLPVDLHLVAAESEGDRLVVTFSDGHTSTFDQAELLANVVLSDGLPAPIGTGGRTAASLMCGRWAELDDPAAERDALEDFLAYGAIVFDGLPTSEGAMLEVADVVRLRPRHQLRPRVRRPLGPGLHRPRLPRCCADCPHRQPLSHARSRDSAVALPGQRHDGRCSRLSLTGWPSSTSSRPKTRRPSTSWPRFPFGSATATPTPTSSRSVRSSTVTTRVRSSVSTTAHGSTRSHSLLLMRHRRYQSARQRLAHLLASPEFEVRFALGAGQLMMFDNNRVMHGRTGFDPSEGLRHLQGCYIDQDGPRTRFRVLSRRLAAAGSAAEESVERV